MSGPTSHLPRFIPTLTEIVDPADLTGVPASLDTELESMMRRVQRQVQPIFERRLQQELDQLVRTTIAMQWVDVRAGLQDEMDRLVRQVVTDELSQKKHG
jgi:alpha-galactosidase/6-phospho-beta-glucosidase family protein